MIKAALVTPNFSLGGAERWIVQLLAHVNPERVQWTGLAISGFCGADPVLCHEAAKHTQLHTHMVPPDKRSPHVHPFEPVGISHWHKNMPDAITAIAADADVLLTWGVTDAAKWFPGVPIDVPRICCAHGTLQESPLKPLVGFTHLAAVSRLAMTFFDNRIGGEGLPREVIYNGVDPEHLAADVPKYKQRDAWGCGPDTTVIGVIGRQALEKNYMAVVNALDELPASFRAVYYGRDKHNYDGFAPELVEARERFGDRLQLYMPLPTIGNVLQALDVVVVASHREGCSLAMMEAWMAGIPVVAAPVGSLHELERQHGELVTPVPLNPSPRELADAIYTATRSGRAWKIADHAQEVAQRHFTIRTMADNWAAYLDYVACSY